MIVEKAAYVYLVYGFWCSRHKTGNKIGGGTVTFCDNGKGRSRDTV